MGSQSVAGSQNDLESRFAYLLQPIRDLAKNWDIDLASQLEDYLSEIGQVAISFDGGATTVNFAEAALLIQGSACIYSRKVEYLYTLVCQVLDILGNNKKQQQTTSTSGDDAVPNEEEEFLKLDDIREHHNITLKNDDDNNPNRVDVVPLTPAILLSVDDAIRASTPLVSRTGEVLASSTDFKMNTVVIHPSSGTALLEASLAQLLLVCSPIVAEHNTTMTIGNVLETTCIQPIAAEAVAVNKGQMDDEGCPADGVISGAGGELPFDDAEENMEQAGGAAASPSQNSIIAHSSAASTCAKPTAASHPDIWKICDPHDINPPAMLKPFRTGKVFQLPAKVSKVEVTGRKRKCKIQPFQNCKPMVSLSEFCTKEYFSRMSRITSNPLKTLNFHAFERLYWAAVNTQKETRKMVYEMNDRDEDAADHEQQDQAAAGDESLNDPGDDDSDDVFQIPDDVFNNAFHTARTDTDVNAVSDDLTNVDIIGSYEELVRRHVENFMASAQGYAQDTDLARRVAEWQERIEPRLQKEYERRHFDIHIYGREFLEKLDNLGAMQRPVLFHEAVHGKPTHEICRYFLSSLQLANDRNVEISSHGVLESSIDTVAYRLLSRRQHFENLTSYQAPSLQQK